MTTLKRFLDFYINSSIHVALAVCSLAIITCFNFNVEVDINLICFLFFSTITGYNFVKYFGLAKFHHRSLANWLKYIQLFSLVAFFALIYFTFKLNVNVIFILCGLGLITFLYAIPFLPKKYFLDKSKNLRTVSGLKIHVIAFVWSITTVIIPIVNQDYVIDFDVVITTIQRFLFVLIVMLPFEIRDMKYDSLKLGTIPQRIGIKQTKLIGIVLIVLMLLLEFLKDEFYYDQLMILVIIMFVTGILLWYSTIKQKAYYSSFWVESIPVFWLLLCLL
ncbi:hypothetical protein [Pontimicrobium sp. IMCC45349]|uniref:hypothetical protein n=1 Tax=Pontimicrobium sp. IMCC45349 TaxID=3391574 RepID=UPI0039A3BFE4